jgi:hypothetical protein
MFPSTDGTGEEENLELQLHDAKLVVVKVRAPPLSVCRAAGLQMRDASPQRKQISQHTNEIVTMNVTNPNIKSLDPKTLLVTQRDKTTYGRKAAKNDSYTSGVLQAMALTFKGNHVY